MKLFDLEIIGQGHSLRNKGQKGQSHEIHKISLLESYDDRFFTKNVSRDHFMPENVFKMKILQRPL